MANLLLPILMGIAQWTKNKFIEKTRNPEAIQEKFLKKLLRDQQNTELGRKYKFNQIQTVQQFRESVPILPYSSYESYLERISQGEENILTADPVVYITLTSGSTGKKKTNSYD